MVAELAFYAVECFKGRAVGQGLDDDLLAGNHVGIEAVQGLSVGHHDIVGDVNDVVDGAQADGGEVVLEPLGAFLHLAASDGHGGVAGASLGVLHLDADFQVVVIYLEGFVAGSVQRCRVAILLEPGIEVACHAIVRAGIGAVGRDVHFDYVVAVYVVVVGRLGAHHGVLWQHDDAGMVGTDANLVLGTDHAIALDAAQLALFDDKLLVAVVELCAEGSHDDFLPGCHVGRSAHNLLNFVGADVHGAHVHVVAVGVGLAGEHFSHHESFQATFDGLHFLNAIHFQACGGKCICYFLSRQIGVDVLF